MAQPITYTTDGRPKRLYVREVIDRDVCGKLVSEIGLFGASQTSTSHANFGARIETPIYR